MKKKLNGFGFRKLCRGCPDWTANGGGFCTRCLDLGVPERPSEPNGEEMIAIARRLGRQATAVLDERTPRSYVPAAVLRGRGVIREACYS